MVPRNTIGSLNTLVFLLVEFDTLTVSVSVISWDSLRVIGINLYILCSLIPLILIEQLLYVRHVDHLTQSSIITLEVEIIT